METKELIWSIITLSEKELRRFMRIWVQTLVPPAVTTSLYFVIFGSLIGPRIGAMDGFDYIQFMIPGLIMLAVITAAYSNVVSSFYGVKFQRAIEELLISPMPNWAILFGYVVGGAANALVNAHTIGTNAGRQYPTTTAGGALAWEDIGTSDQRINFTNSAATNAGEVRITITYQQNNNLA